MSLFSVLHDEATWEGTAVMDSFQSMTTSGVYKSICRTRENNKLTEVSANFISYTLNGTTKYALFASVL